MYPKCILHALLHFKKIHVFYTYPKGVQDTFGIHIKYIKIHVSDYLLEANSYRLRYTKLWGPVLLLNLCDGHGSSW
jgi:hypothetical protein